MKKKIALVFLFISGLIYLFEYSYTNNSFNYHIDQFVGYIFVWSVSIFVLSILGYKLSDQKYRMWSVTSIGLGTLSVFLGYLIGDGTPGMLNFDGESINLILVGLYSTISVFYFLYQYFKGKK